MNEPLRAINDSIYVRIKRYFHDREQINLWVFLAFVSALFAYFSSMLTPVLVAVVIAYLLQWPIVFLQRLRIPRIAAVLVVYALFMGVVIGLGGLIFLLLTQQLNHLLKELPHMAEKGQELLLYLPKNYPKYISPEQIQMLIGEFKLILTRFGRWVLSNSLMSIPDVIVIAIYLILVPLLIYFFLMDQQKILSWIVSYLPKKRRLIREVWEEVYVQTGHYVRGRALEIIIVWMVTAGVFGWMGLPYAMLLGLLVGISSIIPYIGTVIVTIPIIIIGFSSFGWSRDFAYLLGAYGIIVAVDANILVPLLLSEAVSLHPVAIMIAVLVFGGLLGFWGVFFSIPLASLVKALLNTIKITDKPVKSSK